MRGARRGLASSTPRSIARANDPEFCRRAAGFASAEAREYREKLFPAANEESGNYASEIPFPSIRSVNIPPSLVRLVDSSRRNRVNKTRFFSSSSALHVFIFPPICPGSGYFGSFTNWPFALVPHSRASRESLWSR